MLLLAAAVELSPECSPSSTASTMIGEGYGAVNGLVQHPHAGLNLHPQRGGREGDGVGQARQERRGKRSSCVGHFSRKSESDSAGPGVQDGWLVVERRV
jgi:hypothetical protein